MWVKFSRNKQLTSICNLQSKSGIRRIRSAILPSHLQLNNLHHLQHQPCPPETAATIVTPVTAVVTRSKDKARAQSRHTMPALGRFLALELC
ncbi:hypothetical protein J6590_026843 [Homalodisca vitripennis]|nr:hypothetical protein J6590_026843 [Homalodisca vitripennis]